MPFHGRRRARRRPRDGDVPMDSESFFRFNLNDVPFIAAINQKKVTAVAVTASADRQSDVVVVAYADTPPHWSAGIPVGLANVLRRMGGRQNPLVNLAIGPNEEYFARFDDGTIRYSHPGNRDFEDAIEDFRQRRPTVSFGPRGSYVIITDDNHVVCANIPSSLYDAITPPRPRVPIRSLAMHPVNPDDWCVVFEDNIMAWSVDNQLASLLKERVENESHTLSSIHFGAGNNFLSLHKRAIVAARRPDPVIGTTDNARGSPRLQPMRQGGGNKIASAVVDGMYYTGPFLPRTGKPHGWGVATFQDPHHPWAWYVGQLSNGNPAGVGVVQLKSGEVCVGRTSWRARVGVGCCDYSAVRGDEKRWFFSGHWFGDAPYKGWMTNIGGITELYKTKLVPTGHNARRHLARQRAANSTAGRDASHAIVIDSDSDAGMFEDDDAPPEDVVGEELDGALLFQRLATLTRSVGGADRLALDSLLASAHAVIQTQWLEGKGQLGVQQLSSQWAAATLSSRVTDFLKVADYLQIPIANLGSRVVFGWLPSMPDDKENEFRNSSIGNPGTQPHGPGKYFYMHYADAIAASSGSNYRLRLAAILTGDHVNVVPDYCYVVNDSFFRSNLDLVDVGFSPSLAYLSPRPSAYRWQWLWKDNEGQWHPHDWVNNGRMCAAFAHKSERYAPNTVQIHPLALDGTKETFNIDFSTMSQIHPATSLSTSIARVPIPAFPIEIAEKVEIQTSKFARMFQST